MSNSGQPAAVGGPWAQLAGSTTGGSAPGGPVSMGGPAGIPRPFPNVNNTNLPASQLGAANSFNSNIYAATTNTTGNPFAPVGSK